jgi:predicted nucleic acid-binding Zn ribbon protein
MFHGINAGGTPMCPECDGTMKKLMSNPPFRFMNPRGTMGVIDSTRGSREDISN